MKTLEIQDVRAFKERLTTLTTNVASPASGGGFLTLYVSKGRLFVYAENISNRGFIWIDTDNSEWTSPTFRVLSSCLKTFVGAMKDSETLVLRFCDDATIRIAQGTTEFAMRATHGEKERPKIKVTETLTTFPLTSNEVEAVKRQVVSVTKKEANISSFEEAVAFVSVDGSVCFYAANNFQIAKKQLHCGCDSDLTLALPSDVFKIGGGCGSNESLEFTLTKNMVLVKGEGFKYAFNLLTVSLPKYQKAMQRNFSASFEVDNKEFTNALRKVNLIARVKSSPIEFYFDAEEIRVFSEAPEVGNAMAVIPYHSDSNYDGKRVAIYWETLDKAVSACKGSETTVIETVSPDGGGSEAFELSPLLFHTSPESSMLITVQRVQKWSLDETSDEDSPIA